MYYCNNYNIKKGFLRKLTTSEKPQHPDARFIRLASQGVFIYLSTLHPIENGNRVSATTLSTLHPIENGKGFPPQLYIFISPQKKLLWARM